MSPARVIPLTDEQRAEVRKHIGILPTAKAADDLALERRASALRDAARGRDPDGTPAEGAVSADDLTREIEADPVGRVNLARARRMTAVARFFRDAFLGGTAKARLVRVMGSSMKEVECLLTNEAPDRTTLKTVFRAADVLGVDVTFTRRCGDGSIEVLSCPARSTPTRTKVP